MKQTVRINFEFPKEVYPYLKLVCADKQTSIREFATELLVQAIEEYEDEMLAKKADSRLESMTEEDYIDFNEACKLAGWDDEDELSDSVQ